MKHKKSQCAIFIESRLPCEDCDLEGHSATCGWHIDWHRCDCGAFDKQGIKMSIDQFLQKNQLTLIKSFPVLWRAWGCDSEWYLTQSLNGGKILVTSDHGSPRIGSPEELKERIEYYKEITKISEEILKELESK